MAVRKTRRLCANTLGHPIEFSIRVTEPFMQWDNAARLPKNPLSQGACRRGWEYGGQSTEASEFATATPITHSAKYLTSAPRIVDSANPVGDPD